MLSLARLRLRCRHALWRMDAYPACMHACMHALIRLLVLGDRLTLRGMVPQACIWFYFSKARADDVPVWAARLKAPAATQASNITLVSLLCKGRNAVCHPVYYSNQYLRVTSQK